MIHDGLGLLCNPAAEVRAPVFAHGTGDDIDETHDQRHRLGQNLQIQLRAGNDKEQDIQRHRPAVHTSHQFFRGGADIAEKGAGHHAHQQQGEAAVHGADLEFQRAQTHGEHHEGHGQGHTLAAGVEEALYPVQQKTHEAAQPQRQNDFHNRLHHHSQYADVTAGQGGCHTEGNGEQQQTHRVVQSHNQHQQPGHGAVSLVLLYHHHGGGRGRCGGDGAQGDGAGNRNHMGEEQVQKQKDNVYQSRGNHCLQNADDDGAGANGAQLAHPEFVAHGKGDEAQGGLADNAQGADLLQRVKAEAGKLQSAEEIGAQQQSGHQITRDGGQMHQFGKPRHEKTAD